MEMVTEGFAIPWDCSSCFAMAGCWPLGCSCSASTTDTILSEIKCHNSVARFPLGVIQTPLRTGSDPCDGMIGFPNSATKTPVLRHNQFFCKICDLGLISFFEPLTTCHMVLRKLGRHWRWYPWVLFHVRCMGLLFLLAMGGCWLLDCSSASDTETIH